MRTPRASVYIAVSLDGFIARNDGAIDWLSIVEREGEDYGYARFFETVDALVMGRRTYESVLGFGAWPYAGKRCVVLTRSLTSTRHDEELYSGDLTPLFERLAVEGVQHVYVDGGEVIGQALSADLVDTLTISIIPVMLGAGTSLAPSLGRDVRLEHVAHRTFESGLVQLDYRVVRD